MEGKQGSEKPTLLFVDDRSKRLHAALRDMSDLYDLTIACSAREALRLMSSQEFDYVSLDHDLDGCDFQDPDSQNCGMEIVRYLEKTGGWPRGLQRDGPNPHEPAFIVHSKNLFAAHLMVVRLRELGLRAQHHPFLYEETDHIRYDAQGVPLP